MVGLVLVCHSAKLAEGAAEVAAQMAGPRVRIAAAGGLAAAAAAAPDAGGANAAAPARGAAGASGAAPAGHDVPWGDAAVTSGALLGTDATRVLRAIDEAWSEDGVVVLMDLGSAVLSAEMALDLLPEERRGRVRLVAAPFVEGAVAAAVAAGLGDPLERVAEEAGAALAAKAAQLAPTRPAAPARAAVAAPGVVHPSVPTLRVTVDGRLGLHARPAARLVQTAAAFDADVTVTDVTSGRGPVSARSLNAVATLGARLGDELLLRAAGPQAAEALTALEALAAEGFGEPADARRTVAPRAAASPRSARDDAAQAATAGPPAAGTVLHGLPGSPGVVVARARRPRPAAVDITDDPARDPDDEWAALQQALDAARREIERARAVTAAHASVYDAAIFGAHLLFLDDEALLAPAREGIMGEGKSAARSWADAVESAAGAWEAVGDAYLRARAGDLRSVGDQVLRALLGEPARAGESAAGIVVAADLEPADVVALDRAAVRGIACAGGGPASHAAILARSLGIPAVVGAGQGLLLVPEGTLLALDGEAGTVTVDPPAATVRAIEERQRTRDRAEERARARAHLPAVTRDGVSVPVAANVAGPAEIVAAVAAGADGVGLLRTEFVFLGADQLPTEDEQEGVYRAAAEALGGRPLVLRTLDVGADKPLPCLTREAEPNPSLGLRGLRLGLRHPGLLADQLRAALRVAADHDVRLMFPMVATLEELHEAREALDDARATLAAEGAPVPDGVPVGIMVEVPAAALLIEAFAPHVDFFSLGTNDLAQYTLAADRGNAAVAKLTDALHPAVLHLIERTTRAAREAGRDVAVCGEVAGDPIAIPLLLGLGVTELSMAPARIARAKESVRATDLEDARDLARAALGAGSAAEVRRLCGG